MTAPDNLSVFLDFDGTVALADTGRHILEQLGEPGWRDVAGAYRRGEIGSREVLVREWAMVTAPDGETKIAAATRVAREVGIDPGFAALVEELRARQAEVTVVSDGFGLVAAEVCASYDVPVLTNRVGEDGELHFPWEDRCCPCSSCGVCKQAPITQARRQGRTTVLVGDGVSDRKAALAADIVYAKDELADWCDEAGVEYRPFTRLDDVRRTLMQTRG